MSKSPAYDHKKDHNCTISNCNDQDIADRTGLEACSSPTLPTILGFLDARPATRQIQRWVSWLKDLELAMLLFR
jgi:hypothetical protein